MSPRNQDWTILSTLHFSAQTAESRGLCPALVPNSFSSFRALLPSLHLCVLCLSGRWAYPLSALALILCAAPPGSSASDQAGPLVACDSSRQPCLRAGLIRLKPGLQPRAPALRDVYLLEAC